MVGDGDLADAEHLGDPGEIALDVAGQRGRWYAIGAGVHVRIDAIRAQTPDGGEQIRR